eukprot:CAMPEP_0118696772 /NCGR_PEP_ID=MMETSP0800-20121206/14060_1 /TAXON_ID=210618 ORGANISM="Striatella unipunctata, Strain CCMP2910" /NCGR_SAMPLE_ID=MMETSP0800 /ASSEMBLY_ACC=CAM_ASM_000638 /LENGTH=379 /DNA_ID=CAMNT_0006595977 /DNA_START=74 /DNA_END=1214 /DNA_ORIENTATION=+
MTFTSVKGTEPESRIILANLVEQCREANVVLGDVMSVIWDRLVDSKGSRWRHATQVFIFYRALLAADGLDQIRALKGFSETMRPQNAHQVRVMATELYGLLVDRAQLFMRRRVCADARRAAKKPPPPRHLKEQRLQVTVMFRQMHPFLAPQGYTPAKPPPIPPPQPVAPAPPQHQYAQQPQYASQPQYAPQPQYPHHQPRATIVQIPPGPPPAPVPPAAPEADLLSLDFAPANASASSIAFQSSGNNLDIFGGQSQSQLPAFAHPPAFAQPPPQQPYQQSHQQPNQAYQQTTPQVHPGAPPPHGGYGHPGHAPPQQAPPPHGYPAQQPQSYSPQPTYAMIPNQQYPPLGQQQVPPQGQYPSQGHPPPRNSGFRQFDPMG